MPYKHRGGNANGIFSKRKIKQITFIENAGGMIITKSIYEGTSKLK